MANKVKKPRWIIGVDEVGRGPLAGAVYVCAVAMRSDAYGIKRWPGLNDSKKLSAKKRAYWHQRAKAMEKDRQLRISIAQASAGRIDIAGINRAIGDCIIRALRALKIAPHDALVLLDGGLHAPIAYSTQQTIIRGDQSHKIISLASVIAKVTRDTSMTDNAKKYPLYSWQTNKGYGTKAHILSIKTHGLTPLHRKTYLNNILDNLA